MKRAIMLLACLALAGCSDNNASSASSTTDTATTSSVSGECEVGKAVDEKEVGVTDEFEIRTSPSDAGDRIKNEKASDALGSIQYHEIDISTTVKQLCAQGDWTKVQITSPEWLNFVKGWVPNRVLRGIDRTADGVRVWVESDFIWDDHTTPFKTKIIAAVNKITREHRGCDDIDPTSTAMSPSRSKPGKPVFFVTCGFNHGTAFNVWFRLKKNGLEEVQ